MTTESKSPVTTGANGAHGTTTPRARSNRDWWPNQLNLEILHQNSPLANPMGEEFNYSPQTIPSGMFRGVATDTATVGFPTVLITHKDVDAELVYLVTKTIGENKAALVAAHKGLSRFDPSTAWKPDLVGLPHDRQLPAFRHHGVLVGFGAAADHCALYLMSGTVVAAHREELAGYDVSKGTVRFDPARPLPAPLVRRLVKARIAENEARGRPAGRRG